VECVQFNSIQFNWKGANSKEKYTSLLYSMIISHMDVLRPPNLTLWVDKQLSIRLSLAYRSLMWCVCVDVESLYGEEQRATGILFSLWVCLCVRLQVCLYVSLLKMPSHNSETELGGHLKWSTILKRISHILKLLSISSCQQVCVWV